MGFEPDLDPHSFLSDDYLFSLPRKKTKRTVKREVDSDEEYKLPQYEVPPRLPEGSSKVRTKQEGQRVKVKSRYKCVSWEKSTRKWKAVLRVHGKTKTIGRYDDELDAARTINFKCVEHGIPMKNPGIGILPPDTSKLYEEIKKLKEKLTKADLRINELETLVSEKEEEIATYRKLGYCVDLF